MTRYIITGAAGHLGSTIIRLLLADGQKVRGLILPIELPAVEGAEYVQGNILNPESLAQLFLREEGERLVVIHTAGIVDITGQISENLRRVNVTGTKNILALCIKHHVDKLVYVSSVHAIPESGTSVPQTEIAGFDPALVTGGYAKTKAEATALVLEAVTHGLPAVVVHPSGIIGPYDDGRNHLVQMVRDFTEGKLPFCIKGGYDLVDVRDAARGCILAAERGHPGECYILSGTYQSIEDVLKMTGQLCGKKGPVMLPMALVRAVEPVLGLVSRLFGLRPLYTKYSLDTVCTKTRFSVRKAREELGYAIRPIRETVEDTVRWLSTNKDFSQNNGF